MRRMSLNIFKCFFIGVFVLQGIFMSMPIMAEETSEVGIPTTTINGSIKMNDPQSVALTWDVSEDATGYDVYKKKSVDTSYIKLTDSSIIETDYTDQLAPSEEAKYAIGVTVDDVETLFYLGHVICDDDGRLHQVVLGDDFESSEVSQDIWDIVSGEWEVTNGTFNHLENSVEGIITAGQENLENYTVEMAFNTGGGNEYTGLIGRFQDTSNFYYFQMQKLSQLAFNIKKDGGSAEQKVSYAMEKNTWYTLRMVFEGNNIKCYIIDNNSTNLVFDITDTTFSSGKIGVRNKWQTISLDNMLIYTPMNWENSSVLTATDVTDQSVTLSWNEVEDVEFYSVYRISDNSETLVYEGVDTSFVDEGLATGVAYDYYMTFMKNAQGSIATDTITVKTVLVPPSTPSNITSYVFKNAIRLMWDEVAGANGYIVYKREEPDTWGDWDWGNWGDNGSGNHSQDDWEVVYDGSEADYLNLELEEGNVYEYKIVAYNDAGESPESETLSLETKISDTKTIDISDAQYFNWGKLVMISGETDLERVNIKVYNQETKELVYIASEEPSYWYRFDVAFRLKDDIQEGTYVVVAGDSQCYSTTTFEVDFGNDGWFDGMGMGNGYDNYGGH